jgi:hypothetical protein
MGNYRKIIRAAAFVATQREKLVALAFRRASAPFQGARLKAGATKGNAIVLFYFSPRATLASASTRRMVMWLWRMP